MNPCAFKFLYSTWSFHDVPHRKPEIVMKGAAADVGTKFSSISSRSGDHSRRRAEKLNSYTFNFLYSTYSFCHVPHIKRDIVMNGAAPDVETTFSSISAHSGDN